MRTDTSTAAVAVPRPAPVADAVRLSPAAIEVSPAAEDRSWSAWYLTVTHKFVVSITLASLWFVASVWISTPWITSLSSLIGTVPAWVAILAVALVPGWLNGFLVFSLILDRPPKLPLDRTAYPDVTVLVAAYNEEACIAGTLQSLRNQDYPGTINVIVIDDGSTDSTCDIVRRVAKWQKNVWLLTPRHGGKAHALNVGLAKTTTEFVVTIDADTWLNKQALRRLMARFLSDPRGTAAVAGCVLARNSRENFITRMQEWDYFLAISSVKRQQALYQGTLVAQGAFSSYRTHAVREVGGWPNLIGEDIVLTWSLIDKGYRIGFESTAIAFTDVPTKLKAFARQRKRWARGMIEGLRNHGDIIVKRRRLVSFLMGLDLLFPVLDSAYTLIFLPGVVLALFGRFWIAGPMTLAILPITVLITWVMYARQRRVFDELGLKVRRNRLGYFLYLLGYQAIMSPVCVVGYAEEFLQTRKRW